MKAFAWFVFFRRNGYLLGWNLSKGFYIQPFQHLKTINKKNGIFCNSSNVKKNGHQRNVQMYLCKDYDIPFQDGVRINNISLQKPSSLSFADPAPRSAQGQADFFSQINKIIDRTPIRSITLLLLCTANSK